MKKSFAGEVASDSAGAIIQLVQLSLNVMQGPEEATERLLGIPLRHTV